MILGGNMRFKALKELKYKEVPDEWVKRADSLTDEEKQRFIIEDNVPFGEWDFDILANEWDAVQLAEWGLEIPDFAVNKEVTEDDYEIPDEIKTDIVLGDLFEIGQHRLLCGDSTDSDHVAKLMNGQKADMVFTDPPYGVNIKGGMNNSMIAGDLTQTAIPFGFDLACTVATKPDARLYFCGSQGNINMYHKLFEKYCRQLPRILIWVKNGFTMKPNGYHNQYEIIFHGYKPKGGGLDHWFGGRTEDEASDVWQVKRDPSSTYEHPTQKPIELPARAIKNHCPDDGIIYEPFTGSGSTFIAAHQLNRKCYGMEIDPKYCQVIVDRMRKLDPGLVIKRNGKTEG
jgi:DNA modification methylase